MEYQYSGYLRTLLHEGEPEGRNDVPCIEFTYEDIAKWNTRDQEAEREWRHLPVHRQKNDAGHVRLEGRFDDIRRMDSISPDDPCFWVPLSTLDVVDSRFPIITSEFPILEIAYRCATRYARPALTWQYPGGLHLDGLPVTQEWTTVARLLHHGGFPAQLDSLTIRLYGVNRSTEAMEIAFVRFRAMTPAEKEACDRHAITLESFRMEKTYPVLEEFLPLGVRMDAKVAQDMSGTMGVSLSDYWNLAFEDIVKHHHNCVAVEQFAALDARSWSHLLHTAEYYKLKIHAIQPLGADGFEEKARELITTYAAPSASSKALVGWSFTDEPAERQLPQLLNVRAELEKADPNHPLVVMTRHGEAFPLFAPYFAVTGMGHFMSHSPWTIASLMQTHRPLCRRGHFWLNAPGFVYATDTPEWNTSPEMRMMLNLAFAYGARGWFTIAYHNEPIWMSGSIQRSLTGPFLTFSDLWAELGQRMEVISPLAPLFLQAEPVQEKEPWFSAEVVRHISSRLSQDESSAVTTRLAGPDFDLYCVVSRDTGDMTSVHFKFDETLARGLEIYDLTDYIQSRIWMPMPWTRSVEMFPGQLHILLAADPETCERWRDVLAARMIEADLRHLDIDLALARKYNLECSAVESLIRVLGNSAGYRDLAIIKHARDVLLDTMYDSPDICNARSKIIEASAAVCACDGILCRAQGKGKSDLVNRYASRIVPLAAEFTHLRVDLRQGKGAEILPQCETLAKRSLELLESLRNESR